MKKIIIGAFAHESNDFCPNMTTREKFSFFKGADVIRLLPVKDIFEEAGYEIVPTIYARAESYGRVEKQTYLDFEEEILKVVRENTDAVGIWMFCHGAMCVDGIGSGEYRLMKDIRSIIGHDCLISLGMDLHGNIEPDFGDYVDIFRCYHTAPHTDQVDTYRRTAKALVKALDGGFRVQTELIKLKMIFPGEMAATSTEPVKSIIAKLDDLENNDPKIECASFYCGFMWTDAPRTSSSIAVVPSAPEYQAYAREKAEELADYAFGKRREFAFEMESYDSPESIRQALESSIKPVLVTDMGDNPTAGTNGGSLALLRPVLEQIGDNDRALVLGIYDPDAFSAAAEAVGKEIDLTVGIGIDEVTAPCTLRVCVKEVFPVMDYDIKTNPLHEECRGVLFSCGRTDIVVTDKPFAFIHTETFDHSPFDMDAYTLIVTKFGYIYPDLKAYAKRYIMANTPGESYQIMQGFEWHSLTRPIFPLDDI